MEIEKQSGLIPQSLPKSFIVVGIAAAVVLRTIILLHPTLGVIDSDEAVTGLMAMDALQGNIRAFYWGQSYGGSLEALLIALVFAIFGPHTLALKMVPVLLCGVSAVLVYRIGRRTVGQPAAQLASLAFLLWPAFFVWWSTKGRGFYWMCMATGLAAVLLGLRLIERPRALEAVTLGGLLGLSFWSSPQILYLAVPAGIWLVLQAPRLLGMAPAVILGFLIGAFPWLWFNSTNGWPSRWQPLVPEDNFFIAHLWGFFWRAFPRAFGITVPFSGDWFWPAVTIPFALFLVVGVGYSWVKRRREWGLPLLVVTMYPFLFATMPPGWTSEPRYVFLIHPMLALLVGAWIARLQRLAVWALALMALTLFSGATLFDLGKSAPLETKAPDIPAPVDFSPLMDTLAAAGEDRVFADYWIAYRLAFESNKKIIATPLSGAMRNPSYQRIVESSPKPVYVFVKGSWLDAFFSARLWELGVPFERTVTGRFVVFSPATKLLPPTVWPT